MSTSKQKNRNILRSYSLKRISDELSYDPTTSSGEAINQSIWHVFFAGEKCRRLERNEIQFERREKKREREETISDFGCSELILHVDGVRHQRTQAWCSVQEIIWRWWIVPTPDASMSKMPFYMMVYFTIALHGCISLFSSVRKRVANSGSNSLGLWA